MKLSPEAVWVADKICFISESASLLELAENNFILGKFFFLSEKKELKLTTTGKWKQHHG